MIFPSKEGTAGRWTACGYGDTSHLSAADHANISRDLSLSQSLLTRLFQVSTQETTFVVTDTIATPVRNPSLATVASSLFPCFIMEEETHEYECFKAVNLTKREAVEPWVFRQRGELSDWLTGPYAGLLSLLLNQRYVPDADNIPDWMDPARRIIGSWAGDQVLLVSDVADEELWLATFQFRSIARDVAESWNSLVPENRQVKIRPKFY